ncbi:pyridine nucleotide-disulfide oxidoreductase dimerization region [Thalassoporum mexicanum PCC 7367]|uniref:NAD(P)/FAD-dependent oxidoreductase n=1 Tax=Thalassoporum mexicanum TaxID=3457544 RepID=UPI00029F8093|nr:NAD(P)/FAD-dependent oxidoreductase [Pseudanabaena sp. PCC 7367]AFY71096.1 pyridine nucleotide-disulfide oxidoreductase dimerization region [Pseudanabaena sp. PCC 7367]
MAIEYDLVVIGGIDGLGANHTYALASRAAKYGARVALVTNWQLIASARAAQVGAQVLQFPQPLPHWSDLRDYFNRHANPKEQLEALQIQGVDVVLGDGKFYDRQTLLVTTAQSKSNHSPSIPTSETEELPNYGNQRLIKSRNFAIAWTPTPPMHKIVGLERVNYLNCDRLWQLPELPESIALIGGDAQSCTLAQALSRLGCQTTMLVPETHILGDRANLFTSHNSQDQKPGKKQITTQTDVEVARLLQAQLETAHLKLSSSYPPQNPAPDRPNKQAQPIAIYTSHRVTAVAPITPITSIPLDREVNEVSSKDASDRPTLDRNVLQSEQTSVLQEKTGIKIWAGDRTFTDLHLLIPNLNNAINRLPANLGLEKAVVKTNLDVNNGSFGLALNSKCQTSNRRIYGCRSHADIDLILQNTLFLPTARLNPQPSLQTSATQPAIASLGLSEIAARLTYGQDLDVLRSPLPPQGYLKILCRGNGQIVGVHGLGSNAMAAISAIAIAMTKKIGLKQLATLRQTVPQQHSNLGDRSNPGLNGLNLLAIAVEQLEKQQLQRQVRKRRWLERWFMWRRDYNL